MFHKVVSQHTQDVVGFLRTTTTNLLQNLPVEKTENQLRFDRLMAMSLLPPIFYETQCINKI